MRQNLTSLGLIVLLIGLCGFISTIYAAPGDLDTSFSQDGKLVETIGTPINGSDQISDLLIQPDGKIIALGSGVTNRYFGIIARYNTNGSLDSSFGDGGRIFFPIQYASEITLQADGKIIVAGATGSNSGDMLVVRFNSDGSMDTTFDGDGQVTTDFGGSEIAYSVAVQPDGKIVAAGTGNFSAPYDIVLARYNQDGSLDTSFDGDGKVRTDIANDFEHTTSLLIQPDGKLIVTGTTTVSILNKDYMLVRYNQDGSLDTTFDNDGKVTTDVFGSYDHMASAVLQSDGKIVITGGSNIIGSPRPDFVLVRYNTNGSLDTTFDGDGIVTTDIPSANAYARDITIHSDGKIILAGSIESIPPANGRDFIVVRYDTNGSLDTTFDSDGYVITHVGGSGDSLDDPTSVIVQNDGKIIAAGAVSAPDLIQVDFALVRYNSDISLDTSFDGDGKIVMNVSVTSAPSEALDAAIQPDGKIVFAGWSGPNTNRNFAVLRYLPNGLPDPSFDGDGQVLTDFLNGNDKAFAVAVQADGKIVAAGYASNGTNDFVALARYNQDGSLDASFGSGGKLTTGVLGIYDYAYDLIIQPDGKIVAAGFGYNGSNSDIALVRYNSNGSLDTSFGSGGKTVISVLSSHDEAYSVALQADGKIVATGSAYDGKSWVSAAVRVNANGSLDQSFDGDGRLTTAIPSSREGANSVVIQPDGKIVTAGIRDDNFTRAIAVSRYNSNGSLDTSFDGDGQVITTGGGVANSIALQTNGKIVVGGSSNSDFALYRYHTDGSLDTSYGIGGRVAFDVADGAMDTIYGLAFDSMGRAVVGGNSGGFFAAARVLSDSVPADAPFDFDGDGKTDISIYRPANGEWWYLRSSDGSNRAFQFGSPADKITPADYTGDGKTDVAFWRPVSGEWFILRSEDSSFYSFPFGSTGDIPAPADYDGDGFADVAVFRPSTGNWYIISSSDGGTTITNFGASGDQPVAADYDGDGKADIAVFRPSTGAWWITRSSTQTTVVYGFGASTDKAVPADYTGDGKADVAFFRPSTGEWFILRSEDSSYYSIPFGQTGDIPSPGDYDGDGIADQTVFRPSNATWYVLQSTSGFAAVTFGAAGDTPVPNALVR